MKKLVSPYFSNYRDAFDKMFLSSYKAFVFNTMALFECYYQIGILFDVGSKVAEVYNDLDYMKNIEDEINNTNKSYNILTEASRAILLFISVINNPSTEQRTFAKERLSSDGRYKWYFRELVSYGVILKYHVF